MGKVTIVIESDTMHTNSLYALMRARMTSEAMLVKAAQEVTGNKEDIRVYIVPGDED